MFDQKIQTDCLLRSGMRYHDHPIVAGLIGYTVIPFISPFLKSYPLVNSHITMERSTMQLMGKSTISTGPAIE